MTERPMMCKVLSQDYTIVWQGVEWAQTTGNRGDCDGIKQIINIYSGLPAQQVAEVFLHEVMHAFVFVMRPGKKLTMEQQATFYAPCLVAFWRDNPAALRWWKALVDGC